MSRPARPQPLRRHAGFTLIELMVGVVLGMLTVVIIANVFATAEGQKRTTTSGSDAQVAGSLALHALQRDVRMAGYGLAGLVAAGVGVAAAKNFGLIGLILLFAKKAWFLIVLPFAIAWRWLKRLFGGGAGKPPAAG